LYVRWRATIGRHINLKLQIVGASRFLQVQGSMPDLRQVHAGERLVGRDSQRDAACTAWDVTGCLEVTFSHHRTRDKAP